jgi:hypothetical protein
MVITGQNAPAKIAVRPSIEKTAYTLASASATVNAASLTGVMERRATAAAGMTVTLTDSVTAGVTGEVTIIASALRRM